jgi:spore coat protein CotH
MRIPPKAPAASAPYVRRTPAFGLGLVLLAFAAGCSDEREKVTERASVFGDRDAIELFESAEVPSFEFELPEERWTELKANALAEEYVEANVRFDGELVGSVGLRFKGSYGTLGLCFDRDGALICPKLSMKVKFDEYAPGLRFFGLKRLNFHSMIRDATKLHEHIAYGLYREQGLPAPHSSWAVLKVNGEPLGLFAMVEQIDGRFTANRFSGGGDGNLYKEAWPQSDSDAYYGARLETNDGIGDNEGMLSFAQALSSAPESERNGVLGSFMDLDALYRYMALDDAIANSDGITAIYCETEPCENHNYYFYQDEARPFFTLIPWDLDAALTPNNPFSQIPHWSVRPADCEVRYAVWDKEVIAPGCDPFFQALASDNQAYRNAVDELLSGAFAEEKVLSAVDRSSAFIEGAVAEDALGPGLESFHASVADLRRDIPLLRRRLEALRDAAPIFPVTLDPGTETTFEDMDDLGVALGAVSLANPRSSVHHFLNAETPLEGSQDLLLEFEYRDEPPPDGGWGQWTYFSVPLRGGAQDLRGKAGVRMLVKTDKPRNLRIDLESAEYEASNEGIKFGWEIPIGVEPQVVEVRFSAASLPFWARATSDERDHILSVVSGLTFQPFCAGRDAFGYLPQESTDLGYFQLDQVEFFDDPPVEHDGDEP